MKTIAFANTKGGVGKTTLCVNVMTYACQTSSKDVTIFGLDLDDQQSLSYWADRRDPEIGYPEVFQQDLSEDSDLLLAAAEEQGADYLFIDLPGRTNDLTLKLVSKIDLVVCPFKIAEFDKDATLKFLSEAQARVLAVPNETNAGRLASAPPDVREARQVMRDIGIDIADTYVVRRMIFNTAISHGFGVTEFMPNSPSSREIKRLWREITERLHEHA